MKALLLKLLGGLAAIAALQVPVGYVLREPDPLLLDQVQRAIAPRAEAFVLGDSVLNFSTKTDPTSLLDLLRRGLETPVGSFDGPGYTPELHRAVLDYALGSGYAPRIVIVSVNLRSFGELWDQGLQYQYSELRARLRYGDVLALGLERPMASYQGYAILEGFPRSEKEFQRIPIARAGRSLGTLKDVLDQSYRQPGPTARGKAFSLLYGYSLNPRHRKLRALLEMGEACRSAGIAMKIYLTPIDVDSGERTAGPEFRAQVARNVEVIRKALAAGGVPLEDWTSLLKSDQFSYQDYPNEHLNGSGRKRLAEEVIRLIRTKTGP